MATYKVKLFYSGWLNPITIFFSIGILSLIGNLFFYSEYNYSQKTYLYGILSSSLSYLVIKLFFRDFKIKKYGQYIVEFKNIENSLIVKIYIVLAYLSLIISLILFTTRGLMQSGNIFLNLRYAHTIDNLSTYGAGHLAIFSTVLSIYFLSNKKIGKSLFFLSFNVITSLSFAERTSILYSFTIYLYFYFLFYGVKKKIIFYAIAIIIIIFHIVATSSNKAIDSNGNYYLISYFSYSLTAFNDKLIGYEINPSYSSVLGILFSPLDTIFPYKDNIDYDNSGFNVYSYLFPTIFLFGEYGFILAMGLMGIIFFVIKKLSYRFFYFHFFRASMLFSSALVFYAWTFHLSNHIYIVLASIPLFYRAKVNDLYHHRQLECKPSTL